MKVLNELVKHIKSGKDSLANEKLVEKLIFRSKDNPSGIDTRILLYLKAAKLINFNDLDTRNKIVTYEIKINIPSEENK